MRNQPLHDPARSDGLRPLLDGWLTKDALAKELGVSPRTLTRWTCASDGIPHLHCGNKTLYRKQSILAWLEAREQKPARSRRRASHAHGAAVR
jgi:hypothetical protein